MKKFMKVPPKFSELKKEADKIKDVKRRLDFWIKQRREYIQESSWKTKEVNVENVNDTYLTETLKRRQKKYESTDKDHNLHSIESEIEFLKSQLESKDNVKRDGRKKPHSDRQKEIAQKYLVKNRDVLKDQYNGNQNPFVKGKVIPHIIKELGISKDDCLSSRQLCQTLDWNKSK